MSRGRRCAYGGLLVEAKTRLPSDLCEYFCRETLVLLGCNRLRCERCGEWVRNQPRLALEEGVPRDIPALFASQAWTDLPFVYRSRDLRLYACRCTVWEAANNNEIENDHESPT